MTRTHGTYTLTETERGPVWSLLLDPAVRMRARRLFGKVQLTRSMEITIADTNEVCRDLTWFMERYPLEPGNQASLLRLVDGATEHRVREEAVLRILSDGGSAPLGFDVESLKAPRDYQLKAIELLRTTRSLLLTDAVGLGKTLTGLLAIAHADARPAVIVPPTHLPQRWADELDEAFPGLTYAIAKKSEPTSEVQPHLPDVLIVPYSKLIGWGGYLAGKVKTIVFDEAQDLRHGVGTDKGKAAAMICAEASYVLGLTATPIYNYGGEIWNIYDILAPNQLGTREEFGREWSSRTAGNGQHVIADPKALGDHLREAGLMLGRSRVDVGRELPTTIKTGILVDSDHAALDKVKESMEVLARRILSNETSQQDRFQAAGVIDAELRQATGIDKAPHVADFVRMVLESEDRIILWGWHRAVYDIWRDRLREFNPVLYTGSESPRKKAESLAAFTRPLEREVTVTDDDGNTEIVHVPDETASRVLMMSLRSGSGVDGLQKVCKVGVFGELDWSPQVHEQAIGRGARDGMGDDPFVAYFVYSAEGSDPAIMDVLQLKRQQAEPMLSPDGKLLVNSTYDPGRGRRLAEQVLGIKRATPEADR